MGDGVIVVGDTASPSPCPHCGVPLRRIEYVEEFEDSGWSELEWDRGAWVNEHLSFETSGSGETKRMWVQCYQCKKELDLEPNFEVIVPKGAT